MRKAILLCLFVAFFAIAGQAQTDKKMKVQTTAAIEKGEQAPESKDGPKLVFNDGSKANTTLDYGTIQQHSEPLRTVKFKNEGTEPLVIKNARGSCGCTVPQWQREPIMPGEESVIEVRYATNRLGKFSKKVTLTTNESVKHVINVTGNVLKGEEEETVPTKAAGVIGNGN